MTSIVIPVYNIAEYLPRCLDSIIAQRYSDWEVVLVDDGSTDDSAAICDEYVKKDSRFSVCHQKNQGVSTARNKGIELARGEWLTFIDGDDYVTETYLSDMIEVSDDTDLVVTGWIKDGYEKHFERLDLPASKFMRFFSTCENFGYILGKLYRMSVIKDNNVCFDTNVRWAEDSIFFNKCILNCRSAKVIEAANYVYVTREGSSIQQVHPFDSEYAGFKSAHTIMPEMVEKIGPDVVKYFSPYAFLWRAIVALYRGELSSARRLETLRSIDFKKEYMTNKPQNTKEKILTFLVCNKLWVPLDIILSRHFK